MKQTPHICTRNPVEISNIINQFNDSSKVTLQNRQYNRSLLIKTICRRGAKCEECGETVFELVSYVDNTTKTNNLKFLCGQPFQTKKKIVQNCLTVDHILPKSLGGTNSQHNLQILCRRCNMMKSNQFIPDQSLSKFWWYVAYIKLIITIYHSKDIELTNRITRIKYNCYNHMSQFTNMFSDIDHITFDHAFAQSVAEIRSNPI